MTPDEKMIVLVVQEQNRNNGWYLALVPDHLNCMEIWQAIDELGIEPGPVCEVQDWRESSNGVQVGFMRFAPSN